jgi:GTPase SAR1 family protein
LVGNKSDLNDDRIITKEIGKQLAKNYHLPGFVECSAKTGNNVEAPFIITVKKIMKTKMPGFISSISDLSAALPEDVNETNGHKCCCT